MTSTSDDAVQWDVQNHCFTVLHEGSLTSSIQAACWCPTMDLVAVVTVDTQLSVHRMNWQRLWSVSLEAPVTAMCWRPDGKVLATASTAGIILYDVEQCEVLKQQPAAPYHTPGISYTHLHWLDASAGRHNLPVDQALAYRHMRLFSKPGAATTAGPDLDLTTTTDMQPWPQPPQALNVLVCSNEQGAVTLLTLGTFPMAHLPPPGPDVAHADTAAAQQQQELYMQEQSGETLDYSTASHTVQAQTCLTQDLKHMLRVWRPAGSTALHAALHAGHHISSRREQMLQLAVLFNDLTTALQELQAGMVEAGQQWRAAQQQLSQQLDALSTCLTDHQEAPLQPDADTMSSHAAGMVDPLMAAEPDIQGELICMLASGHISPGMLSWLTGTLAEHGIRRLAQQLDSAINSIHALLLHTVGPRLELVVFLLGELRGVSHPLLQGASTLGLKASDCKAGEVEAVRALLQCEALQARLTILGEQYRQLFTWLLKTVLLLECGGTAAANTGTAALSGPAATAAAAAAMTFDETAVLQLLEGPLMQDLLGPDLCEGWFDPDITPASLCFDPAVPMADLQRLMAVMHQERDTNHKAEQPELASDIQPANDQNQQQHMSEDGNNGKLEHLAANVWPNKPFRKQVLALSQAVSSLSMSISTAISPQYQPMMQVTIVPHVDGEEFDVSNHWYVRTTEKGSNNDTAAGHANTAITGADANAGTGHDSSPASPANQEPNTKPSVCEAGSVMTCVVCIGEETMQHVSSDAAGVRTNHGTQGLLFLHFRSESQELIKTQYTVRSANDQDSCTVEAVLLQLPPSTQILDVTPYKDLQTAVLIQSTSLIDDEEYTQGADQQPQGGLQQDTAQLLLLPEPQLQRLDDWQHHESVLQACIANQAVLHVPPTMLRDNGQDQDRRTAGSLMSGTDVWSDNTQSAAPVLRTRTINSNTSAVGEQSELEQQFSSSFVSKKPPLVWPPLAVSASRGLALVLPARTRLQILDLEENEESDKEDEEQADDDSEQAE